MLKSLELLAPAKNLQCGIAAIDHGADAVYIGAQRFGARSAAGNSNEDIAKLCEYAHQFGAKVYVTVNTIIYNDELEDTLNLVKELQTINVDALLVQDMGLFSKLTEENGHNGIDVSKLKLHASTQTDNRSIEKVKWLSALGFKRIVIARELSIEEIKNIHEAVPEVELEVFVHGALCVSYSGQCYASQHCFNRSANRGECAQFCRLAFTLKDANGHVLERDRHLLSLKDMCQLDNMELLAEAGAMSFKIEGRLKDVDYVKNVTSAYSQKLNEIIKKHPDKYRRASFGHFKYNFQPDVKKSFNRGFTEYFAHGRTSNLVSFDTPKAMGEYVGKVKELRGKTFNVSGTSVFANGDGLCFLDQDHQLVGFRVNKVEGNRIYPLRMPYGLKPGTMIFRNFDQQFNAILSKRTSERKLYISFSLTTEDETIKLEATDEMGRKVMVSANCELQEATKPQDDNIRKQLTKLGGTIYECKDVDINTNAFIPSSILTSLRRDAVEALKAMPLMNETDGFNAKNLSFQREKAPLYQLPYLYNASNNVAKNFYKDKGIDNACALETEKKDGNVLMQCRYCLRNEMGYCTKNGKRAPWKEPLTITMSDGREFKLHFDCKNCQMNVEV